MSSPSILTPRTALVRPRAPAIVALALAIVALAGSASAPIAAPLFPSSFIGVPVSPSGYNTRRVEFVDVDGDPRADLVTFTDVGVDLRRSIGGGRFAPAQSLGGLGDSYLRNFALVDLDRNGARGFLFSADASLDYRRVNSDGTFGDVVHFDSYRRFPFRMALMGDLDRDGMLDILAYDGRLSSFLRSGGVGLRQAGALPGLGNVLDMKLIDIEDDGDLDVFCALERDSCTIVLNNGAGVMGSPRKLGPGGSTALLGDLDGNGLIDLVSGRFVYLNRGSRVFQAKPPIAVEARRIADVTGDGIPDLLGLDAGAFLVFPGKGDGAFLPALRHPSLASPMDLAVADVDGDGDLDVAVVSGGALIAIHLNAGGGAFPPLAPGAALGVDPGPVRLADANGDGRVDLIAGSASGLAVFESDPAGEWKNSRSIAIPDVSDFAWIDLDENKSMDLVTARRADHCWEVRLGPSLDFDEPRNVHYAADPMAVGVGDFDGNGQADVAIVEGTGTWSLHPRNGVGEFSTQLEGSIGGVPFAASFADFDGRGRLEALVATASELKILWATPTGTLQSRSILSFQPPAPRCLAIGDLDGNGAPDVALVAQLPAQSLVVLLNDGAGAFHATSAPFTGSVPNDARIADVNSDARPDLIFTLSGEPAVTVRLGVGDGTFEEPQYFMLGTLPERIVSGDVDGDGAPDLVVTHRGDSLVTTLVNRTPYLAPPNLVRSSIGEDRVDLEWSGLRPAALATVERRQSGTAWEAQGSIVADAAGHARFTDGEVASGGSYGYRLAFPNASMVDHTDEAWIDVAAPVALALQGPNPNPVTAASTVRVRIAESGTAFLELLDVQGRREGREPLGFLAPGTHTLPLGAFGRCGPGLHFLRFEIGGRSLVTRFVAIR